MKQSKQDVDLGHYLSLTLRHNPTAAHITLDTHGWADVQKLLDGMNQAGKHIDLEILERIVRENDKKRYCFNEDHTKIRASQGHSVKIDLGLKAEAPPAVLYHGTATRFLESIRKNGIVRQSRQYVHLSADRKTAETVGSRHGTPTVLVIDATSMVKDGFVFYRSENGIWLCEKVPWCYVVHV